MSVSYPRLKRLLRHCPRQALPRVLDSIEDARRAGMAVNLDDHQLSEEALLVRRGMADILHWLGEEVEPRPEPVFPEVTPLLIGAPANLGALCGLINEEIREEFRHYDVTAPSVFYSAITAGAMSAGSFDAGLAYLLEWTGFEFAED